jgi:hypothetical protein
LYTAAVHFVQPASDYPRTYRASSSSLLLAVVGGICVAAGALGIWYFGTGHGVRDRVGTYLLIGISAAFLLGGAYLVRWILGFRIVLTADAIEFGSAPTATVLRRDEIAGWRTLQPSNGPAILVLVPRDSLRQPVKIQKLFQSDAAFESWLAQLPNLDAQDRQAAEQEIAANPDLGVTPDERMATLAAARRTARILNGMFVVSALWAFFYPRPYWLAVTVLAALPWVAVVITARSHGLFRIDQKRNDPHPTVGLAFLMPGFILALRAMLDVHVLRWQEGLWLAGGLGLLLWAAALMSDATLRTKKATAVALFFLVPAYGYGAGALGNALLDKSPPRVYAVKVVSKYVSSGRSTTYNLRLEAWGPRLETSTVSVSHSFYNSVQPGSPVCIVLRPGALHVAWYVVRRCR